MRLLEMCSLGCWLCLQLAGQDQAALIKQTSFTRNMWRPEISQKHPRHISGITTCCRFTLKNVQLFHLQLVLRLKCSLASSICLEHFLLFQQILSYSYKTYSRNEEEEFPAFVTLNLKTILIISLFWDVVSQN